MPGYYEMPTLDRHVPEKVLDAIKHVLEREFGADRARELLNAIDDRAEYALRPPDPEMERQIAANKRKYERVLRELADTEGVQVRKVFGRHHVVTLDGKQIGCVDPVGVSHSGNRSSVIGGWRPSLTASTTTLQPQPTVESATRAVKDAHDFAHGDGPVNTALTSLYGPPGRTARP